jgi:hypothetical protein
VLGMYERDLFKRHVAFIHITFIHITLKYFIIAGPLPGDHQEGHAVQTKRRTREQVLLAARRLTEERIA